MTQERHAPEFTYSFDSAVQAAHKTFWEERGSNIQCMRAALTAALPHLTAPCSVEVKKLDWFTAKGHICDKTIARDCFGNEFCRIDLNGKTEALISKIKTKAQSDYEQHILSQIITKPVDVAAVRKQAFEEAANEISTMRRLLNNQTEALDIFREEAAYIFCEKAIRALFPAEPVDQWHTACGRLPTLEEAKQAARLFNACNGADLSEWSDDLWPCGDLIDGLKELISHERGAPTSKGGE